jgi:hypothetical protein
MMANAVSANVSKKGASSSTRSVLREFAAVLISIGLVPKENRSPNERTKKKLFAKENNNYI